MLPNFVVIGASRSGTTSLHEYLSQHPDVYVPPRKSPNFFVADDPLPEWESPQVIAEARHWIDSRSGYERLFQGVDGESAIGDVSPVYLQSIHAANRIRDTLGEDVRIVLLLRQPAQRAWAHYNGRLRDGLEHRTEFAEIIAAETAGPLPDELAFGHYVGCGRYGHFIEPYFNLFGASRVCVFRFEDFVESPGTVLEKLCEFLGVSTGVSFNTRQAHNPGGVIRNPLLRTVWTGSVAARRALRPYLPAGIRNLARPVLSRQVQKPQLDPVMEQRILSVLAEDIRLLQDLTGMDFSNWLGV